MYSPVPNRRTGSFVKPRPILQTGLFVVVRFVLLEMSFRWLQKVFQFLKTTFRGQNEKDTNDVMNTTRRSGQ